MQPHEPAASDPTGDKPASPHRCPASTCSRGPECGGGAGVLHTLPAALKIPNDDFTAGLTGSWGSDQAARATVFVSSAPANCCAEVALHLRLTIAPNYAAGYEFNCSVVPSKPYMEIVRWEGSLGATAVGSTLTLYKNGVAVVTGSDATHTDGAPGIGFYLQFQTGINDDAWVSNFAANAF